MVEKDNCVTDWLVFRISFFFFFAIGSHRRSKLLVLVTPPDIFKMKHNIYIYFLKRSCCKYYTSGNGSANYQMKESSPVSLPPIPGLVTTLLCIYDCGSKHTIS